ncbi:hypothetical protein WEH80_03265 [Actinomycetes bacterium KLBMP 9759]
MPKRRATRGLSRIVVATVAITGAIVVAGPAPAAHADATGCTITKLGQLCNITKGKSPGWTGVIWGSTHVTTVEARLRGGVLDRGLPVAIPWLCDIEFNVHGTLSNGKPYSNTKTAKCGYGQVYTIARPDRAFEDGSKLCVRYRELGARDWEPYQACNKIHD